MLSEQHLKIVQKIYNELNKTDINWAITGSTAFAIQGVPLIPNDIDIQTDKKGAYQIEKCLERFI